MEQFKNTKVLFIIANAGHADYIIAIAKDNGAGGATVLNARGEGSKHEVFMGITVDVEKEIILCLVDENVADRIMTAVKEKAGIGTKTHAVCFTMPVDKMIGINTVPFPKIEE